MKSAMARKMAVGLAAVLMAGAVAGTASAASTTIADYQWAPTLGDAAKRAMVGKINSWIDKGYCYNCDFNGLRGTFPKPVGCATPTATEMSGAGATAATCQAVGLKSSKFNDVTFAEGMNLSGYNLKSASFNNATMKGVNISGAQIDDATFMGTKFSNDSYNNPANLEDVTACDNCMVPFDRADIKNAKKPLHAATATKKAWPKLANLSDTEYVGTTKCDSGSRGGCYKATRCGTKKVRNDDTCEP